MSTTIYRKNDDGDWVPRIDPPAPSERPASQAPLAVSIEGLPGEEDPPAVVLTVGPAFQPSEADRQGWSSCVSTVLHTVFNQTQAETTLTRDTVVEFLASFRNNMVRTLPWSTFSRSQLTTGANDPGTTNDSGVYRTVFEDSTCDVFIKFRESPQAEPSAPSMLESFALSYGPIVGDFVRRFRRSRR